MTPRAPSLGKFVLGVFLWLPPCFAAWYLGAAHHGAIAGWLARRLLELPVAGMVSGVERHGVDLVFVTTLLVHPAPGQSGLLTPEVNPLLYTYGLALFLALSLAARASWWKVLLGAVLLVPFQAWGIAFDFLAQVGVRSGPDVAAQAGLLGWRAEAIALGYQLGSLVLPSVAPVVLWAALNRPFIGSLLRRADPGQALPAT